MTDITNTIAFALTGHICGQCKCSNESGWSGTIADCDCRAAAKDVIAALRKTHAVVPRIATPAMVEAAREVRSSILHDTNTLATWDAMIATAERSK